MLRPIGIVGYSLVLFSLSELFLFGLIDQNVDHYSCASASSRELDATSLPQTKSGSGPIIADTEDIASPYAVFTFTPEQPDAAESLCQQTGPGWHCETHPLEGTGQNLLVLSKQSQKSSATESAAENHVLLSTRSADRGSRDTLREKLEILRRLQSAGATSKELQTILPPHWSRVRTSVVSQQAEQDPVFTCQSEPLDVVTTSPRTAWFDDQGFATGFQERNWIKRSELLKAAGRVRCLQVWASPNGPRTLHTGVSQPFGKDRLIWSSEPQKPLWLLWDLEARSATLSMHVTAHLPRSAKVQCTIMNGLGNEPLLRSACPEGLRPSGTNKGTFQVELRLSNSELSKLWMEAQTQTDHNDRYAPRELLLRIASESGDAGVYGDFRLDLLRTNYAPTLQASTADKLHGIRDSRPSPAWCVGRISDPENDHVVASLLVGTPRSKTTALKQNKRSMWTSWKNRFNTRQPPNEHSFAEPAGLADTCTLIASDGVLVSQSTSESVPAHEPSHMTQADNHAQEPGLHPWKHSATPEHLGFDPVSPRTLIRPQSPTMPQGQWYLARTSADGSRSQKMFKDAPLPLPGRWLLACLDPQGQSCLRSPIRQGKRKALVIDGSFRLGRHFILSSGQNPGDTSLDIVEVVNPTATAQLRPIPSRSRWYASLDNAAQQATQRQSAGAGFTGSQQDDQSIVVHCYVPETHAQECSKVQGVLRSKMTAKQLLDFHKSVDLSSQLVIVVIKTHPNAGAGYQSILFTQLEETLAEPLPQGSALKPAGE